MLSQPAAQAACKLPTYTLGHALPIPEPAGERGRSVRGGTKKHTCNHSSNAACMTAPCQLASTMAATLFQDRDMAGWPQPHRAGAAYMGLRSPQHRPLPAASALNPMARSRSPPPRWHRLVPPPRHRTPALTSRSCQIQVERRRQSGRSLAAGELLVELRWRMLLLHLGPWPAQRRGVPDAGPRMAQLRPLALPWGSQSLRPVPPLRWHQVVGALRAGRSGASRRCRPKSLSPPTAARHRRRSSSPCWAPRGGGPPPVTPVPPLRS